MNERRGFLKKLGLGLAGVAGLSFLGEKAEAVAPNTEKRYVVDFEFDTNRKENDYKSKRKWQHADAWTAKQIIDFVEKTKKWLVYPDGVKTNDVEYVKDWLSGKNNHFVYVHMFYGKENKNDKNRNTHKWARFIDPDREQVDEIVFEGSDFWFERKQKHRNKGEK